MEARYGRGLSTRRGKPLSMQTLHAILRNPLYAGRITVPKWGIVDRCGDFEALVSEAVFDRVHARLSGRLRGKVPRTRNHLDFPLRRFVRCGDCGNPLTGAWSSGRSARYGYYECARCRQVRVGKIVLERAFVALLSQLEPRPEYMRLFNAIVLDVWKKRQSPAREDRGRLQARVVGLRQRLDKLVDLLARGVIDEPTFERNQDELRQQIVEAEIEFQEAAAEHLDVEAILAFAQEVLTNAARLWEQASLEHKQRLQSAFFPEGLVFDGRGFRTAVTCLAFEALSAPGGPESYLASPTGFEPVSPP
jgi:site-specific DNA recombinase